MTSHDLEKIDKFPHLAEFNTEQLVTGLGLYEPVLIDTRSLVFKQHKSNGTYAPIYDVDVAPDVKALHDFLRDDSRVVLPCYECGEDRPFIQKGASFLDNGRTIKSEIDFAEADIKRRDMKKSPRQDGRQSSDYDSDLWEPHYWMGIDNLIADEEIENLDSYRNQCAAKCYYGVLNGHSAIRKEFQCTLDDKHRIITEFIIRPAADCRPAEMDKDAEQLYYKHHFSLIFEKIGQYPSMADMQLFDSKKYRNILGKNYRDYTTALGLYASGIGSGSFLYLRRVLEKLVEEIHQECRKDPSWDEDAEEEYIKAHFDQRIKILEKCGKTIIPDELNQVKNQLYDALSIGVHEAPDDECKELFPFMKFAIDCILDKKIQERERNRKIKELTKATTEFTNKHNC